ncbi:replication protein A 70 kDa DNA-binding subunit B-like [Pyrus ussuriensis x Pyrus communis]|uniref:Replication protein A 70 kDa DNA-binding subunit B-like n=1 Tax=Pyrus ussuriensis x Pyrus communis TaxID=2448454 RepID=A0A5N5I5K8_9ROSA|nr:replication protein A 70 kDa DNA-binding subunit B-like [Pyrus ussuriensis x Pyrus communis]
MTINKSQGQSLKIVGLYLLQIVFSHGQLYVALSRVTSTNGLKIVIAHDSDMPYGRCGSRNHERSRHLIFFGPSKCLQCIRRKPLLFLFTKQVKLPMHWFNLIELDQLHWRINNDVELTVITIQSTRVANKRNLNLQNIRDKIVRITLWGETATSYENSGIQSLLPPIFVALTCLKENLFSEAHDQLFVFSIRRFHSSPNTNTIEMYTGHAISANSESKSIDELLLLDLMLHKVSFFVCQTTIVGFDLTKGWWYKSCSSCHKAVKNNFESFEYNEHEDGYNDHFVVSPALNNLIGETKQFQLSFGNQNTDFGKIDFVVHGLLQNQPLSSPTIALVTPQTTATIAGKQIMTEVTPIPLTPSYRKPRNDQTETTNFARIAREFHNLVVPKIEPADKVLIATLKTKSQTKKKLKKDVPSHKK